MLTYGPQATLDSMYCQFEQNASITFILSYSLVTFSHYNKNMNFKVLFNSICDMMKFSSYIFA